MRFRHEFYQQVEPYIRQCLTRYLERYDGYVDAQGMKAHFAGLGEKASRALYIWVRRYQPSVVIETGVCNGISSYVLLKALAANGRGHLWSIDKPHYIDEEFEGRMSGPSRRKKNQGGPIDSMVPRDWGVGWAVLQELRSQWTLIEGDAKKELPLLVNSLPGIDLFIHDSLHLRDHILWECRTVWPKIRSGGMCVIDNAGRNDADHVLESEFGRSRVKIHGYRTIGFIK